MMNEEGYMHSTLKVHVYLLKSSLQKIKIIQTVKRYQIYRHYSFEHSLLFTGIVKQLKVDFPASHGPLSLHCGTDQMV